MAFTSCLRAMVRHRKVLAMVGLLLVAAFLRLYRIDRYMQYQGDEGRDSLVLWRMVMVRKFTLIGPGTSIGNMYNGPLYYYLVLPSFVVSGLSPVGPSVFVALLGVVTVWLLYKVGNEWFSPMAGATAAVFYALSPTVIINSRSSWNPNVMPFFSLLCLYSLWMVCEGGKPWWLIVSSVSLAFAIQSHYLGLLLLPTVFVWWIVTWRRIEQSWQPQFMQFTVYAFLVFSFLMSPLLLFDLRHRFINFRAMLIFFTERQTTVNFKIYKAFPEVGPIFSRMVTTLVAAGERNFGILVSLILAIGSVWLILKGYRRTNLVLLLVWIVFGLIGLGLYKQTIYDHYFGFLFPTVFVLFGAVVGFIWQKLAIFRVVVAVLVIWLSYLSISRAPIMARPNDLYQHAVTVSKIIVEMSGGKPFNLGMIANQNYDDGYRFVLTKWGVPLREVPPDMTEQLFVVCELEPSECKPVGNPKAEIANFGWVKIDRSWNFPWGVTLFRLVHNKP